MFWAQSTAILQVHAQHSSRRWCGASASRWPWRVWVQLITRYEYTQRCSRAALEYSSSTVPSLGSHLSRTWQPDNIDYGRSREEDAAEEGTRDGDRREVAETWQGLAEVGEGRVPDASAVQIGHRRRRWSSAHHCKRKHLSCWHHIAVILVFRGNADHLQGSKCSACIRWGKQSYRFVGIQLTRLDYASILEDRLAWARLVKKAGMSRWTTLWKQTKAKDKHRK